jgi:serine protein kinase
MAIKLTHIRTEGEEIMAESELFDILQGHVEKENALEWEGTLKEYVQMVTEKPELHRSSHQRILDMIESHGVERDEEGKIVNYKFFENDLFGIDESIHEIMKHLRAAATGSEVSRRILLLFGPTSSGKSQLAILLKRGLEAYSKTEEGAIFALRGSPMNEDPLCAIPHELRPMFRERYGINIQGDLSPLMSVILHEDYHGDFLKLPVHRIVMSERDRNCIGTFVPSDKKSQDISELVGSLDLSTIGEYGTESDPRAYRFDGELNVANRGLMEFVEMLKVDQKFLYVLLTLAQEKNIKTGRFPLIYADEFILAHTNETEYNRFLAKDEMEALHDRTVVVRVPYNLKVDEEVRIYDKLIAQANFGDKHIAPHTLRCAAMLSILSRLKTSSNGGLTLLKKMRLYNGEEVEGFTVAEAGKFKREFSNEGMSGLSPRYVINRISAELANGSDFITPIDIIRSLRDGFESNPKIDRQEAERLENLLTLIIEEYNKMARNDVQKAFFVNFEKEIGNLLKNYLDQVEAYLDDVPLKDEWGHDMEADERLMRSVEEKVGISESGKRSFRQEIYRKMLRSLKQNGEYRYQDHPRLREALEKQLFDERQDVIRLTVSSRNPDKDELERINGVVRVLCERHGYTAASANQLLRYVSSLMARN